MPDFVLMLHDSFDRERPTSTDAIMAMVKEYAAWGDKMRAEGRLKGGNKLMDEPGRVLRQKNGSVSMTDGPYTESKELVGGYFIIDAKDYDDACKIAQTCPHMKYGAALEVRQVDAM